MTKIDEFELSVIKYGVVSACEWFGYNKESDFTNETMRVLKERHPEAFKPIGDK